MKRKVSLDVETILRMKVLDGMSNAQVAKALGVAPTTISNRIKGLYHPKSLANALVKDYLVNAKLSKISERHQKQIREWISANILELCKSDGFMSIGQQDYKSRQETIKGRDFTAFYDWITTVRE